MHPRNPYKTPPDFRELADVYPDFAKYLRTSTDGSVMIDFKDAQAQRCLTEALLHRDFELKLSLPDDRLCPPVPNRLNYLLWIQDLLQASGIEESDNVVGLDIGVGASAIYPLLGCRICKSWSFIGTEVDDRSYKYAIGNISQNDLSGRIRVAKVKNGLEEDGRVFSPLFEQALNDEKFAFSMCNPPFYSSAEDVAQSSEAKYYSSHSVCLGADNEIITPGGEVSFVGRMVEESCEMSVRQRCLWFTSMLGKHASVAKIVGLLKDKNVDNYAVTELIQGTTRRWVVAWSFSDIRLPDAIARSTSSSLQSVLPLPNTLRQTFPYARSQDKLWLALRVVLQGLQGLVTEEENELIDFGGMSVDGGVENQGWKPVQRKWIVRVKAWQNTWSRAARRKKALENTTTETTLSFSQSPAVFECTIISLGEQNSTKGSSAGYFECTWTRGYDRRMFETFWSHVCRKVGQGQEMVDES